MDDPLLTRAKLLVNLANGLPSFSAAKGGDRPTPRLSPRNGATKPLEVHPADCNLPSGSFLVSVVRGSSLLSTTEDIRPHLRKGSSVLIDGVEYSASSRKTAEWSSTRIELASDYNGPTNLYATLQVKDWVPKKSPQKRYNSIEPVASSDIRDAIRALDEINPSSISSHRNRPEIESAIVPQKASMRRKSHNGEYNSGKPAEPIDSYKSPFDGSYLAGLLERRGENDARLEEQRRQAMLRVAHKKKQDELEQERRKKEEENNKASIRLHMDSKARELHERTLKRVSGIKKAKSEEEKARLDVLEQELKRKADSDALVKSEEYKLRMQQLRLESKQKMRLMQKSREDVKRKEDLLMKKQLSQISEQRRRHDVGPIKKTSIQKYEDSLELDRPKTDGIFSVENEMGNDLGYAENEEGTENDDTEINAEYRAAFQLQKSRPRPLPEQNYYTEAPRAVPSPLGGTGIRYNPSATSKAPPQPRTADDDDDDGYWSNDSLGDDMNVTFNEPPEPVIYRSPPHRAQPNVHQSFDSDDMTTLSAITLGSPKHMASSNRIPPQQQPRQRSSTFKPLKPLPVRPFVPVPPGK